MTCPLVTHSALLEVGQHYQWKCSILCKYHPSSPSVSCKIHCLKKPEFTPSYGSEHLRKFSPGSVLNLVTSAWSAGGWTHVYSKGGVSIMLAALSAWVVLSRKQPAWCQTWRRRGWCFKSHSLSFVCQDLSVALYHFVQSKRIIRDLRAIILPLQSSSILIEW